MHVSRETAVDAQAVLKATNVDGIFDSDPRTNSDANLLTRLTYRRVSMEGLSVMDATAITLCEENDLPGMRCSVNWAGPWAGVSRD